jgi:hypothetical protein
VDLPLPIPPVRPTRNIAIAYQRIAGAIIISRRNVRTARAARR